MTLAASRIVVQGETGTGRGTPIGVCWAQWWRSPVGGLCSASVSRQSSAGMDPHSTSCEILLLVGRAQARRGLRPRGTR